MLVLFTEDTTVVPKESSWFGSYAPKGDDEAEHGRVIPMRMQELYVKDTFGLKTLDKKGAVKLLSCEAEHMRLSRECWEPIVKTYTGGNLV